MQFPAELADIGDAQRAHRTAGDAISRTWPNGNGGVRHIGIGDGGEHVAGARPHQRERAAVFGDVGERGIEAGGNVLR